MSGEENEMRDLEPTPCVGNQRIASQNEHLPSRTRKRFLMHGGVCAAETLSCTTSVGVFYWQWEVGIILGPVTLVVTLRMESVAHRKADLYLPS